MLIVYIGLLPYQGKTGFQNEDTAVLFLDVFLLKSRLFLDMICYM